MIKEKITPYKELDQFKRYIWVEVEYHYNGGTFEFLRIVQTDIDEYSIFNDLKELMADHLSFQQVFEFYSNLQTSSKEGDYHE